MRPHNVVMKRIENYDGSYLRTGPPRFHAKRAAPDISDHPKVSTTMTTFG